MKPLTEPLGSAVPLPQSESHIILAISAPGGYSDNRKIAVSGDVEELKELASQAFQKAVATIKKAVAETREGSAS